jgi:hypothetical protein
MVGYFSRLFTRGKIQKQLGPLWKNVCVSPRAEQVFQEWIQSTVRAFMKNKGKNIDQRLQINYYGKNKQFSVSNNTAAI